MNDQHPSKDEFFERLGAASDEMVAAYGKDFAMGALVLAARFIAESKTNGDPSQNVIHTTDQERPNTGQIR